MVAGSAGAAGSQEQVTPMPQCERPIGTVALVEKQIPALAQMGLTSPVPLLRLMVSQSNCFQVVDRGQALARIEDERRLSGRGGVGQLAAAQYYLTPDIVFQNANAGAIGGGVGTFLPGVIGVVASSVTQNSSEAQTALYLTSNRSSVQVAAATGSAKSNDYGFALGAAYGGMGGLGGGYANTAMGKTITAAFLDAYSKLVKQVQAMPQGR